MYRKYPTKYLMNAQNATKHHLFSITIEGLNAYMHIADEYFKDSSQPHVTYCYQKKAKLFYKMHMQPFFLLKRR